MFARNLHARLTLAVGAALLIGVLGGVVLADTVPRLEIALWLMPALSPLVLLLARGLVLWGIVPLRRLANDAETTIDLDQRTAPLDLLGDDELAPPARTMDRLLDRLEDADEREQRLTSDASHELRAPLAVIRAEAELMLRRPRTTDEYQRALRSIAVHAGRLEALTRDLLAAARGEARPLTDLVPLALGRVAREAASSLRPLAEERAIRLDVETADDAVVVGFAHDLSRATICALHNAIKFAPDGGRVRVACRRIGERVRLDVEDDGPGFSPQGLRHAVERFWQDDAARTNAAAPSIAGSGSGLGLSIAHAIVTSLGGSLRLANREPRGAVVSFEFAAAEHPAAALRTAALRTASPSRQKTM